MKTIGIYQLTLTRYSFEHRCMNNIKKIYQHAGKRDDQQNINDIIDSTMVLTPERVTDDSHNVPMTSSAVQKKQVLGNQFFIHQHVGC